MILFFLAACPADPKDTADSGAPADTADTADSSDTADTADTADTSTDRSCAEIEAEFVAETDEIRACEQASDCGTELTGTSCGCTRNWVARGDADTTEFYALLGEGSTAGCDLGTESTCDCPEVTGYDCVDQVCTWAYPEAYNAYPACESGTGLATTVDSVVLDGDSLLVGVSYGGGCAEHFFATCWSDQAFAESSPVQASLELSHWSDEPDDCDGWMSEVVTVDLDPLRAAYVDAYGGSGTVIVNLGGYSVEYSF